MDNFYKTYKNNTLNKLLDPFEMFYIRHDCKIKYHQGAYDYYKEIGFITFDKNNKTLINSNVKSKLMRKMVPYELRSVKQPDTIKRFNYCS